VPKAAKVKVAGSAFGKNRKPPHREDFDGLDFHWSTICVDRFPQIRIIYRSFFW
jgi:hypothetical protein